jgi:hypothetical protein
MSGHLFGAAGGDDLAVVQNDDLLRQRHHGAHDMLDQENGYTPRAIEVPEDPEHAVDLGRPQARHCLVEEQ